jgi:internalin A
MVTIRKIRAVLTPKRRWFQFSLRTLLLLVAVLAVWLGWHTYRVKQQREAVLTVEEVGGLVRYDYQWTRGGTTAPPNRPSWLARLVGVDHVHDVVSITLAHNKSVTDADLRQLSALKNLRDLNLGWTEVSDAGLVHLKQLTRLESLYLEGCPNVTDSGIAHLAGLTNLKELAVSNTGMSNAGMVHLKNLKKLEWLELTGVPVEDDVVQYLRELTNLKVLFFCRLGAPGAPPRISAEAVAELRKCLPQCSIIYKPPQTGSAQGQIAEAGQARERPKTPDPKTLVVRNHDEAVAALQGLPAAVSLRDGQAVFADLDNYALTDECLAPLRFLTGLEELDLSRNPFGDAGLAQLSGLHELEVLQLDKTHVGDAGLKHLKAMRKLKELWLSDTRVTDEGLETVNELSELHTLRLDGTQVTDAGLRHLQGLGGLKCLDLSETRVTGAGLNHLKNLNTLETLVLRGTQVSDQDLIRLHGLKNLKSLDLRDTQVTRGGVRALKSVLPECNVRLR